MPRELRRPKPGTAGNLENVPSEGPVVQSPTNSLDLAGTEYLHSRMLLERSYGTAILMISEDLDELLALSDRVLVFFEGRIMAELSREQATRERVGLLMAGVGEGDYGGEALASEAVAVVAADVPGDVLADVSADVTKADDTPADDAPPPDSDEPGFR